MNQILVIGNSITYIVIETGRLPDPGETIVNGAFMSNSGGIGANKAASISAKRMRVMASAPYRKEIADLQVYTKTISYTYFSFSRESEAGKTT
jgi:hypothetical protein